MFTGLWLNGWESGSCDTDCRGSSAAHLCVSYPSVTADLATNARALAAYLATIGADTLHLVGHSMGGLLILECSRVGSPARGRQSGVAVAAGPHRAARLTGARQPRGAAPGTVPLGRSILGLTADEVLLTRARSVERCAATSASSPAIWPVGLGRLLGPSMRPTTGRCWSRKRAWPVAANTGTAREPQRHDALGRGGEADRRVLAGRTVRAMKQALRAPLFNLLLTY